jgi:hypothetical protein
MTNPDKVTDPTALLTDRGFTFSEDTDELPLPPNPPEEMEDDDLEFQPIQRKRMHWLTLALIGLIIWGAGFLVGVIVDRAFAG